jgi:hypothetical protein
MKLQMRLKFVTITCLDGKVILWMDTWMDENLIVFTTGHSYFGNLGQ